MAYSHQGTLSVSDSHQGTLSVSDSHQGTLSVPDSYQGTLSVSDDDSSGLFGELNYGVQSLSPTPTSDYNTLTNKPRINNVELVGNITTERLGIRNGEDGFSPVITERETELGYDITITDVEGSNTITLKNGTNGTNGLDGTNGQDGKSAYEIAVDNGFVGTEQEWLESLKGQDGKDGIVMDAPADSKAYARKDNAWVETVEATNVYTKTEANDAFLPKTTVIPTKTSELTNDSGFITSIPDEYVTQTEMVGYAQPKGDYALKSELFSKDYNDLTNKPTIPTNTSDLTNDSGFITAIPEEYVTNTEMTEYAQPKGDYALKSELFSKSYNDLTDKPTIPTKTSELTNDSGFITEIPTEYITQAEMQAYAQPKGEYATTTYVDGELNKKADQTTVDSALSLKANSADVTASLAGKSDIGHTHDDRYYTESETNTLLGDKVGVSDFNSHVNDTTIHVTAEEKASWNGKAEISDIPSSLPANGGNADTLDGLHASDIQIDTMSDTAGIVTLDELQGSVPFSDITLSGDIVGQEITLTACGKNLADLSDVDGKLVSGISFTYDNGNVVLNGTATAQIYLGIKIHLPAGTYTISGGTDKNARVVLRNKSWLNIADAIAGATVTVVSDDYYVHIAISSGTVCDNVVIKPQLERGAVATEYEPYSGSTVTITPDSNPYTVSIDIRQQDGLNNISVSAGEVSVTGVKKNTAIKKIWDNKADLSDIPTTLPANGGNADTLDGKHASDFMPYIGAVTDLFTVNKTCICKYTSTTLNTPYKANLTTSTTGLCIVNYEAGINHVAYFVSPAGSTDFYTAVTRNGEVVASKNWRKVSDNGNAATLETHPASDFVLKTDYDALAARVAALEGGTT